MTAPIPFVLARRSIADEAIAAGKQCLDALYSLHRSSEPAVRLRRAEKYRDAYLAAWTQLDERGQASVHARLWSHCLLTEQRQVREAIEAAERIAAAQATTEPLCEHGTAAKSQCWGPRCLS